MAAPVICIYANFSEESVRSSPYIIILSDTVMPTAIIPPIVPAVILPAIHADIPNLSVEVPVITPIAPEAKVTLVASPAGVLDTVIHSSSESDPSEYPSSPEHAPIVPSTSLFLFSDSFEAFGDYSNSNSSKRHASPNLHKADVARFKSKVALRSSSFTGIAPSTAVAPYSVHTSPIRDAPIPAFCTISTPRLTGGCTGCTVVYFDPSSDSSSSYSDSSSKDSSFDTPASSSESLSHSAATHSHSGPLPRRRPQGSDYVTPSPSLSARPSQKRCRFRGPLAASSHEGSIEDSSKASTESDIDLDILADIEADITTEATAASDVESSSGDTIEIGVDVVVESVALNDLPGPTVAERWEEYKETMKGMYEHLLEIPIQRVRVLEGSNMRLQDSLSVKREKADSVQHHLGYVQEELKQIRVSHYYDREDFRRLETFVMRHHGYSP
ncbi:hypothetical protein Tco_0614550 [Tanacetum coccineum]